MPVKKTNYIMYHIIAFFIRIFGHLYFLDKVIGKENIPLEGKCILAGNHVSNFDAFFLFRGTKRPIHILGKIELFQSKWAFIFKWMHLIPVDRTKKNPQVITESVKLLQEDKIIGIFPEGTFHKESLLLPFKGGVISMAQKSGAPIVPFAILGKIKFWGRPKIIFAPPIDIMQIKEEERLTYLEETIKRMLINNQ